MAMMFDFDNLPEDENFELSPEEIASIKRGIQEANMGFTYEFLKDGDKYIFKCSQCGREKEMGYVKEPFPHKFECPMRDRIVD